jgi:hypothetical protein
MSQTANSTQYSSNNDVAMESVDRFDLALAAWFAQHPGAWYGTVTELIAALKNGADAGTDLWPQGRAFLSHLESHRRTLRSLGVDVSPHAGFPRMISLRSCQGEMLGQEQLSTEIAIDVMSDSFCAAKNVADGGKHAHEHNSARRVFENTAEALFAVVEMQDQVEKQASDLKSALDLVTNRTQELIGCSGIAVGLLQQKTLVYAVRLGSAAIMATLPSQMSRFDFCVRQGTVLSLPDVLQDPVASSVCYPEGVRSLIILPIFHNHAVAGTMELLFAETRYFSTGDIMTLELITDIVSARVTRAAQPRPTQPEGRKSHIPPRITECVELEGDPLVAGQSRLSFSQYVGSDAASGAFENLESSIPDTTAFLAAAPVPRKRVWTKLP